MTTLILIFSSFFFSLQSEKNAFFTTNNSNPGINQPIPKVTIQDTSVVSIIRRFKKTLKDENMLSPCVIFLQQSQQSADTSYYKLGYYVRLSYLLDHVPYAYTYVDGQIVLLYTVQEKIISYSEEYMESLKELVKDQLIPVQIPASRKNDSNYKIITDFWNVNAWRVAIAKNGHYKLNISQ